MFTFIKVLKFSILYFLSMTIIVQSFIDEANYFNLILNVHRFYGTSCVFLIHNRQESPAEFDRIQELIYKLSSVDVLVSSLEFKRMTETLQLYGQSVVRPLVVVGLRDKRTFDKFEELTRNFDMADPCWLMLFNETIYLKRFDGKLSRNMFNLRFNTEMLVARTNRTTIQEWYWLNVKVRMENIAEWDFDKNFTLANDKSLYRRRSNLEGRVIPVTTLHNVPILTSVNNSIGGLCGAILKELGRVANFTLRLVSPRDKSYGSWNNELKKWTGMIDVLVKQEAIIGAAEFTISASRVGAVDFTFPLITTRDKLFIREPQAGIHWSSYWQTLAPGNWMVIQTLILTTTTSLTLITFVGRSRITPDVVSEYFLLVFGIYCQQGLPEFPSDSPSRIVYFSIFLSAMVVMAAYSAALISFLTINTVKLPFTTLEEYVEDGSYQLIVFQNGAEYDMFVNTIEPTMARMRYLMKNKDDLPKNLKEGFDQVCSERVALYLPGALQEAYKIALPCRLIGIDTGRTANLAMALAKGNPYNGLINYHIQKFRDHGLLDRLKRKFAVEINTQTPDRLEVTTLGIIPILVILTGGIFLAILIYFIEKSWFRKRSRGSIVLKNHKMGKSKTYAHRKISKLRPRHQSKYLITSKNFYY